MPEIRAPRTADSGGGKTRFSTRTDSMALMVVSVLSPAPGKQGRRGTVESGTYKPLTGLELTDAGRARARSEGNLQPAARQAHQNRHSPTPNARPSTDSRHVRPTAPPAQPDLRQPMAAAAAVPRPHRRARRVRGALPHRVVA